ncbi:MAG TPA: 4'-phosphopantetheinyl transferase superfamily protein [Oscillospiraceae bacterium]|nr:4'-phosphopantetheinyl transferase superfamily protein [Oscillospiraceae bacterium]HPK36073.1 4'-phosphopantetheinyl transferase superfamily protein [Oscillospiraceae bacterium]HPR76592.1 4'-phosphopantetheinyl transferase superfamily protein [Oscillospiraceae bacterium]
MLQAYYAKISNIDIEDPKNIRLCGEKLTGMHNKKAIRQSMGARLLLCRVLSEQYPGIPLPPQMTENQNGKPYLAQGGLYFNLSHSADYAALVLSDEEAGIDIEKLEPPKIAVAKRFFSKPEYDWLAKHPMNFYDLWVLKESYVKALGTGMTTPMSAFSIVIGDEISLAGDARGAFGFYLFNQPEGYRLAVCKRGNREECGLTEINIGQEGRYIQS